MFGLVLGLTFGAYFGAGVANKSKGNPPIIVNVNVATEEIRRAQRKENGQANELASGQAQGQVNEQAQRQELPQCSARTQKRKDQRKRSKARKEQEAIESNTFRRN